MPTDLPPLPANADLRPAAGAEIVESLAYALRFDDRGKARRIDSDLMAKITAEWLTRHLLGANFVVMRKRPKPPHSTG